MSFKNRQVRRFYLTGKVPFPMPFPSAGAISFERAKIQLSPRGTTKEQHFVIVHEKPTNDCDVARVMRIEDISAIFFPGEFENIDDPNSRFKFSPADRVEDFENGAWFFEHDIRVDLIINSLKIKEEEMAGADSSVRGIVFVPEDRPVITRSEVTQAAGATSYVGRSGCDCCN
jgi:hypothetical protein